MYLFYYIQQAELKHQKAIVIRDQCLPQESINLLKEACNTFKTVYGKDHVKVALIESELSVSLRHNNNLKQSEKVALSALKKLTQGELYHSGECVYLISYKCYFYLYPSCIYGCNSCASIILG